MNQGKLWVFVGCICGMISTSAWADDDLKQALAELKGTWTIESVKLNGEDVNPPESEAITVEIGADHMMHGDNKIPMKIFTGTPKLMDLTVAKDTDNERTLEGIYKIEDKQLTICMFVGEGVKERPVNFEPGPERIIGKLSRSN